MLQIFKASLETRHFTFEAYGYTEVEALYIMRQTWMKHSKEYKAAKHNWGEFEDDVHVQEIIVGAGYRDGEIVHRKVTRHNP